MNRIIGASLAWLAGLLGMCGIQLLLMNQAIAQEQPFVPTGVVTGSGNYFSPIVADLPGAVTFYRDVLGFEVSGDVANAAANPALRDMFGLPGADISWQIARAPGINGGIEIIRIDAAGGSPVARRMQDPGAFTLLVIVRDLDEIAERAAAAGTPILTVGGQPAEVPMGAGPPARLLMLVDPDGHFVEVVGLAAAPAGENVPTGNILEVRVRLTVADLERAMHLYETELGMLPMARSEFADDVAAALGIPGGSYRFGMLRIPTSGIVFEVMEWRDVPRTMMVTAGLADPGSTRIQLRVRDMAEALARLGQQGGRVVSTGGKALALPAGAGTLNVAIVQEPDNLFLVLIETPPEPASP